MAIERKFIKQNVREFTIKEFIEETIPRVGLSKVTLKKTPLGDKIVIAASRPGLVVGRGGANIQMLTKKLKAAFELENPQIEIEEVEKPDLDADIVCERIINTMERFGSGRTKAIGHRTMADVMRAGALGIEILITGKIPSMRSRRWRFYQGYLKKSGDLAVEGVLTSIKSVTLKSGAVGVQVMIMPPSIDLPDHITLTDQLTEEVSVEEAPKEEKLEKVEKVVDDDAQSESPETAKQSREAAKEQAKADAEAEKKSVSESKDSGTEDKS